MATSIFWDWLKAPPGYIAFPIVVHTLEIEADQKPFALDCNPEVASVIVDPLQHRVRSSRSITKRTRLRYKAAFVATELFVRERVCVCEDNGHLKLSCRICFQQLID
jgi:hypothetical protein